MTQHIDEFADEVRVAITLPITGYQRRRRTDRSAPRPPADGIPVDWLVRPDVTN